MVYLLHEMEHSELRMEYPVFKKKNVRISVYILQINFAESSPFRVLCGKKYAGLKKVRYRR